MKNLMLSPEAMDNLAACTKKARELGEVKIVVDETDYKEKISSFLQELGKVYFKAKQQYLLSTPITKIKEDEVIPLYSYENYKLFCEDTPERNERYYNLVLRKEIANSALEGVDCIPVRNFFLETNKILFDDVMASLQKFCDQNR